MKKKIPTILLLLTAFMAWGQTTPLHHRYPLQNQYFASAAKNDILFQREKNGNLCIYLFSPEKDTAIRLTHDKFSALHPVWVPGKNAIVFDTGANKQSRLIYLDLKTKHMSALFHRKIACREASFTPSRHLVVFSGFDDQTQQWQIFSYDFIYDNLNRLTAENGWCTFPVFSPDGKHILYIFHDNMGNSVLKSINWYGGLEKILAKHVIGKACWTSDSWRVLFVSHKGNLFSLQSIRHDGSGIKTLLTSFYPLCCPVSLPKGDVWILAKTKNTFQLQKLENTVPVKTKNLP